MKQWISLLAALLVSFSLCSTTSFAHSYLEGSTPEDGETITTELTEIELKFDGKIEIGSAIELKGKVGGNVPVEDIIIGDGTLTGTVAAPLANDKYEVSYSIISADGHPIEGDFDFEVDVEGGAQATPSTTSDSDETESRSTLIWMLAGVVVVIIAAFFTFRRKK